MRPSLSIRSRLILLLLLVSGSGAVVLILVGRMHGKTAMERAAFAQLNSVRSNKVYQIESYFQTQFNVVESLSESPAVKEGLRRFRRGFRLLTDDQINAECSRQLSDHYTGFIDRLSENIAVNQKIDLFYPTTTAACYLQFEYIVENPNPTGHKDKLMDAEDGSYYTEAHRDYHPYLHRVQREFGFYDLFLVDLESGDIVYSVFKETDFATNLYSGPYRESNFAQLVRDLRINRDLESATIVDYDHYRPSYGKPASFIGIPVVDGGQTLGALVIQLPLDEVDNIMTGNQNWAADGLGESGETYLVGEDYLMRSTSRFFLQDTLGYRASQREIGVSEEALDREYRLGTTILEQRVRTEASERALSGKSGIDLIPDYRGIDVLSSYTPLNIPGLEWVLLSEIDASEAFQSVSDFERQMFIALCLFILAVTFLAMLLAAQFLRPVEKLNEAVRRLSAGDFSTRVDIKSRSEFGELGNRFNGMIDEIEQQNLKINEQSAENEKLLLNFIPEHLVKRLRAGELTIADQHDNVSLLRIDLVGFSQYADRIEPLRAVELLNDIMDAFDDAATRNGVEKIRSVGDSYFAVCGMFQPRLDHTRRLMEFALEIRRVIRQINLNHRLELSTQIGIHTGPVTAGIVGHRKFNFDLIGHTTAVTLQMCEVYEGSDILVSEEARQRLLDFYEFVPVDIAQTFELDTQIWKYTAQKS